MKLYLATFTFMLLCSFIFLRNNSIKKTARSNKIITQQPSKNTKPLNQERINIYEENVYDCELIYKNKCYAHRYFIGRGKFDVRYVKRLCVPQIKCPRFIYGNECVRECPTNTTTEFLIENTCVSTSDCEFGKFRYKNECLDISKCPKDTIPKAYHKSIFKNEAECPPDLFVFQDKCYLACPSGTQNLIESEKRCSVPRKFDLSRPKS
jgi:hypothetical protein